ncbi:hypothetical protein ACHAXR_006691 [Thalassiosira sp. AJA248-18]
MPPAKKRRIAAARAAAENNVTVEMEVESADPSLLATKLPMGNNDNNTKSILTSKLLEQHRETLKLLQSNIAELASSVDNDGNNNKHQLLLSSSLALANLKSLQRQISLQVESHNQLSKNRRETVEECSLVLENLNYERNYLRGEIGSMRGWKASELEKMAWCELGIDPDTLKKKRDDGEEEKDGRGGVGGKKGEDVATMEEDADEKKITTAEEAIDAHLLSNNSTKSSSSHRDPSNHTTILSKLQSDLNTRSTLVTQLSQSKTQLKELQKKRDSLRGFLNQIPKKLAELDKAGETLNNFFFGVGGKLAELDKAGETLNNFFFGVGGGGGNTTSDVWKNVLNADDHDDDDAVGNDDTNEKKDRKKVQAANLLVNRPSCDRTKRFQLAQSNLPSPLYVLFVQLAGYMDAWASLEKLGEGGGGRGGGAVATTSTIITGAAAAVGEKRKSSALDGFVGASGMNVSAVPPQQGGDDGGNTNWSVVLTLSPSGILPSEISTVLGGKTYSSRSSSASSSQAAIKIVFSFSEEEGMVLASVKDEKNNKGVVDNDGLLDNLFPGDDGLTNPNVSMSLLKQDENNDEDSDDEGEDQGSKDNMADDTAITKKNEKHGKPYYWCQVLGGLNFPPPTSSTNIIYEMSEGNGNGSGEVDKPFQIQTCTKAVFRQLLRRIRARKTLTAILEYLGKRSQMIHPLPIHPTMRGEDSANHQPPSIKAKLHSWAEDTNENNKHKIVSATATKRYIATIKRKSATLKASVVIDTQSYPATPPVWSLQNEDGSTSGSTMLSSWGEEHGSVSSLQAAQNNNSNNNNNNTAPPLFDAAFHRIECHVNQDLDKFVRQDVETTYDWILIHQLADIVSCWDEVMSADEGGSNVRAKSGDNDGTGIMMSGLTGRLRKGKDRRLMGFGEFSPFYWYRNGL